MKKYALIPSDFIKMMFVAVDEKSLIPNYVGRQRVKVPEKVYQDNKNKNIYWSEPVADGQSAANVPYHYIEKYSFGKVLNAKCIGDNVQITRIDTLIMSSYETIRINSVGGLDCDWTKYHPDLIRLVRDIR